MKVLFCSSEATPFSVSGGLGDVSASLPKTLCKLSVDCRIVIPFYKRAEYDLKDNMKYITHFYVPVAWRNQYCGVYQARYENITYYLLDNEYYFKRPNMYGYYDDAERFTFFSRAILELISHIDFLPDIIHANDWQTALVPVYFSTIYAHFDHYRNIKTIFTIHNIEYQGIYGREIFYDLIGLNQQHMSILDYDQKINLMKGAIEASHTVTTVSPTYLDEILNGYYDHGLSSILNARKYKLHGILNGIDTDMYNPQTDKNIYINYSATNIKNKKINKQKLQQEFKLKKENGTILIGMITRLAEHKGIELLTHAMDTIMRDQNVQFAILGSKNSQYENFLNSMRDRYFGRIFVSYDFSPELARKIYAASDLYLMPSKSEPCGLSQMIALRYGTIPVVHETGGLCDSISDSEDGVGNGFRFRRYDAWDMYDCIKRAIAGYQNFSGWTKLMERAMRCNYSWQKSAKQYIKLYQSCI